MAKKRRIIEKEQVEEDYEFVPPKFDEAEFIYKDFYGTKVLLIVAAMAVVFGIICALVQVNSSDVTKSFWYSLIILFVGMFLQKPLLKLFRIRVDLLETKSMIGNYILFLFLGLGVWILGVNPPFH